MNWARVSIGAVVAVMAGAGVLAMPTVASAAEKATGAISCGGGSEIHTISSSKGNVTHQIYGAIGYGTSWAHTNSVTAGYSATYASWNTHHVWEFKANGGKVFASGINSGSVQCR